MDLTPEFSPLTVYTIRRYVDDNLKKPIKEYIFVGDLLDHKTLGELQKQRLSPGDGEIRDIFEMMGVEWTKGIEQIYIPHFLELNDSWETIYYKITDGLKLKDDIYLWIEGLPILTHRFYQRENWLNISSNPWDYNAKIENIFEKWTNLRFENRFKYLLRSTLTPDIRVLNLVTKDDFTQTAGESDGLIRRYFPRELKIQKPFYSINDQDSLNQLLRNRILPENLKDTTVDWSNVHLSQCVIHINGEQGSGAGSSLENEPSGIDSNTFINLGVIFDLITLNDRFIFCKMKKGEKGISKISNHISKYRFIDRDELFKWSDPAEAPKGLLYRKIKDSPGLVTYSLHENGFIEVKISWKECPDEWYISQDEREELFGDEPDDECPEEMKEYRKKTATGDNQLKEILKELRELNDFLADVNTLEYQLMGRENRKIQIADLKFTESSPTKTNTRITQINSGTLFSTRRKMVNLVHVTYLAKCLNNYLISLDNWKIFNNNVIVYEDPKEIKRIYFHYIKTNNNLNPNELSSLNAPIYYLGLEGNIRSEQSVTKIKKKELIVKYQNLFGQEGLDMADLETYLEEIEDKNQTVGVQVDISGDNINGYVLNIKGAHNIWELKEIHFIFQKLIKYYFHLKHVRRLKKSVTQCSSLKDNLRLKTPGTTGDLGDEKASKGPSGPKKLKLKTTDASAVDLNAEIDLLARLQQAEDEYEEDLGPADLGISLGISPGEEEPRLGAEDIGSDLEYDEEPIPRAEVKTVLEYLEEISSLFKKDYARHACPKDRPVVMSISEFWRNFERMKKKIAIFKDKLTADEQKKFPTGKDRDLNLLSRQVEYLGNRLKSADDKASLKDFGEIITRYERGLQMRIPLDKDYSMYSQEEYFFYCPLNWCPVCRESKLASELGTGGVSIKGKKTSKPTCAVCSTEVYSLVNTYVGFPSNKGKKHLHLRCLPCCYKKDKISKKAHQCAFTHPTREIKKPRLTSVGKNEYILTGPNVPEGRWGFLDGVNDGPLNLFFNDGHKFKTFENNVTVFVRKGVKIATETNNAFLEALTYYGPITGKVEKSGPRAGEPKILTADELREYLIDQLGPTDFLMLNNGIIATIFKTESGNINDAFDNFKSYLASEYVNEDLLWNLVSLPGIILEEGMNLMIIEKKGEGKYTLLCPNYTTFSEYYNPNKPVALMLKISNSLYQPVSEVTYQVSAPGASGFENRKVEKLLFLSSNPPIYKLVQTSLKSCTSALSEYEGEGMPSVQEMLLQLDASKSFQEIEKLYLDPYHQITYVFVEIRIEDITGLKGKGNRMLKLPIKSSPISEDLLEMTLTTDYGSEDLSLDEMLKILPQVEKETKLRLKPKRYLKNDQNYIHGIELENTLVVTFKPIKEGSAGVPNKSKLDVVLAELPSRVDAAIRHQKEIQVKDEKQLYINQITFQKEAFQRLRFELSKILSTDKKVNGQINVILAEDKQTAEKARKSIEKILLPIIKDISTIGKIDLAKYVTPQVRNRCLARDTSGKSSVCELDPHCTTVTQKGKKTCVILLPDVLYLPNNIQMDNSYTRYVTLITDEIVRNHIKRAELMQGKVSIYVNPDKFIYNPDRELLLKDEDYAKKIEEMYRKSTDYTNLYNQNYFLVDSEVYTRETRQNLYALTEAWYKIFSESWVHNRRNIYSMLDRVFESDVSGDLATYMTGNNWKKWLSALKKESPEEYETLNTKDVFVEEIKYGKPILTQIHLALISFLKKVKIIVVDKNKPKNFVCLGTTQSTDDRYLILYRDMEDDYLIGETPNVDMLDENGVVYLFKAKELPERLISLWREKCPTDHRNKIEGPEELIKGVKINEDILDQKDIEMEDIGEEPIIHPPGLVEELEDLEDELGEKISLMDQLEDMDDMSDDISDSFEPESEPKSETTQKKFKIVKKTEPNEPVTPTRKMPKRKTPPPTPARKMPKRKTPPSTPTRGRTTTKSQPSSRSSSRSRSRSQSQTTKKPPTPKKKLSLKRAKPATPKKPNISLRRKK